VESVAFYDEDNKIENCIIKWILKVVIKQNCKVRSDQVVKLTINIACFVRKSLST
jgi:hypothetical protein